MKQKPKKPGSLHHWRTEKERWLARKHQVEVQVALGKLVDTEEFSRKILLKARDAVALVMNSSMTDSEKAAMRAALAALYRPATVPSTEYEKATDSNRSSPRPMGPTPETNTPSEEEEGNGRPAHEGLT